jgi:hypothetical protein
MKALIAIAMVAASVPLLAAPGENAPAPPKQHRICRTIDRTGSHMGERICLTPDQWVEHERNRLEGEGGMAQARSGSAALGSGFGPAPTSAADPRR